MDENLKRNIVDSNELSINAKGGTELVMDWITSRIDPNLLRHFQFIPSRVREIDQKRLPILILHDLPHDRESQHLKDPSSRDRFAGIVMVSNWQMQMYNWVLDVPYSECKVLQNAIIPFPFQDKPEDSTIRLIYHSTPQRGLSLLIPVFEQLCLDFPQYNLELDVFSSFQIYGWPHRDKPFEDLFKRCKNHPQIRYHGYVSNENIRDALLKADIHAYPCIWPETSCISAIEALAARCVVVCPNFAALPETCANWAMMYQWSENEKEHTERFRAQLIKAIEAVNKAKKENHSSYLKDQASYFNKFYDVNLRAEQWNIYLSELLKKRGQAPIKVY